MTNHEVWDKTIELNGVSIQSVVCMEKCSELIKAISKRLRGELDIENNLAEEMARRDHQPLPIDPHVRRRRRRRPRMDRPQDRTAAQAQRAAGPLKRGHGMSAPSAEWIIGYFADGITAMRTKTEKRYGKQPLEIRLAHEAEWKREYRRKRKENNERQ